MNYGIEISYNRLAIAGNNATLSPFMPKVTAAASQRQDVLSKLEANTVPPDTEGSYTANQYTADVTLRWTLFDGMGMFTDYKTSHELLRGGELNLRNNIERLVADISGQYYNIVTQEKRLEVTRRYLEISTLRYNQALEKYVIGSISGLEMKQAKIDFNADSSKLVLQQEVLSNAYTRLFETMNIDLDTRATIRDSIVPNPSLELDALKQAAMRDNTEILMARSGEKLSELKVSSAKALRYPSLDFVSAYRFDRSGNTSSSTRYTRLNGPMWGFSVTGTLFDGGNVNRQVRNSRLEYDNSSLAARQTELAVASDITQVYNTYRKNILMIAFEQESSDAAMANLEAAMEMYRLGTMSGVEFREIQRSYLEAVDRMLAALYQAKESEISLLYLAGRIAQ